MIFDVLVDLRKNSKTFGKYFSICLSNKSYCSIYIPEGFAHGFCCLDKENIVYYGCSNYKKKIMKLEFYGMTKTLILNGQ